MSRTSDQRSEAFLKISDQFKLGALVTEASHPVTAQLSELARKSIPAALDLLFQVDSDVVSKYREFVQSRRAEAICAHVLQALRNGGRLFFTGCGSTGRLSIQLVSIWRDFWQRRCPIGIPSAESWEDRAFSVMAGGDFALIKSVEGFEDFAAFGEQQLGDLGVSAKDVVFAITEGGETSFVIGTAWKGVDAGAQVYFVYNNPDEALCRDVERSREVIEDTRIEKINLTTGPMAITGSTRMQATTIQLCVLLTVLEMVLQHRMRELEPGVASRPDPELVPGLFLDRLAWLLLGLRSENFLAQLASLVALEEAAYRGGRRTNYYADRLALDVLTDTTERSPTYCTPPFRKFDDPTAAESWAFLFTPESDSPRAWTRLLKRPPACIEWDAATLRALVGDDKLESTLERVRRISTSEFMRFRIGRDGLEQRPCGPGDTAIAILAGGELESIGAPGGSIDTQLLAARHAGGRAGLIQVGGPFHAGNEFARRHAGCQCAFISIPPGRFLLASLRHVGLKLTMNALSTCTMVRLGRVLGNTMIWVVPSNLKLIDRATRYLQRLSGLPYGEANRLLFEVIEHIEPRMAADRSYPPVVGLAVLRARHNLTNSEAEMRFAQEASQAP